METIPITKRQSVATAASIYSEYGALQWRNKRGGWDLGAQLAGFCIGLRKEAGREVLLWRGHRG